MWVWSGLVTAVWVWSGWLQCGCGVGVFSVGVQRVTAVLVVEWVSSAGAEWVTALWVWSVWLQCGCGVGDCSVGVEWVTAVWVLSGWLQCMGAVWISSSVLSTNYPDNRTRIYGHSSTCTITRSLFLGWFLNDHHHISSSNTCCHNDGSNDWIDINSVVNTVSPSRFQRTVTSPSSFPLKRRQRQQDYRSYLGSLPDDGPQRGRNTAVEVERACLGREIGVSVVSPGPHQLCFWWSCNPRAVCWCVPPCLLLSLPPPTRCPVWSRPTCYFPHSTTTPAHDCHNNTGTHTHTHSQQRRSRQSVFGGAEVGAAGLAAIDRQRSDFQCRQFYLASRTAHGNEHKTTGRLAQRGPLTRGSPQGHAVDLPMYANPWPH